MLVQILKFCTFPNIPYQMLSTPFEILNTLQRCREYMPFLAHKTKYDKFEVCMHLKWSRYAFKLHCSDCDDDAWNMHRLCTSESAQLILYLRYIDNAPMYTNEKLIKGWLSSNPAVSGCPLLT